MCSVDWLITLGRCLMHINLDTMSVITIFGSQYSFHLALLSNNKNIHLKCNCRQFCRENSMASWKKPWLTSRNLDSNVQQKTWPWPNRLLLKIMQSHIFHIGISCESREQKHYHKGPEGESPLKRISKVAPY